MKKLIFSLLVLVGLAAALPADELWLGEVPFVNMSADSKDTFIIKYETEKDEYYIQTSDWLGVSKVIFNNEQFEAFRGAIAKAQEWSKLANEKKVEIEKELPNSNVEANAEWNWGVNKYRNASWDKLKFMFLFNSAAGNNNKMVSILFIAAPKITSSYDEDVTYSFPLSLLSENEINTFMNVISQKNIDKVLKKHEESEKVAELFN